MDYDCNPLIPREPKGFDYRDDPEDMDVDYLVDLAFQLYARSCDVRCSEFLHNRSQELKNEVVRRLKLKKE